MKNKTIRRDVLILNGISIPLTIQTKRKLRISFRFIEDALFVSAPYNVSITEIKSALTQKEKWILKHYALSMGRILQEDEIRLHDQRVKISYVQGPRFSYAFASEGLTIVHTSRMKKESALKRFKGEYSEALLSGMFNQAVKETGLKPALLTIRETKSSHGRCNSKKQITLSSNLIAYNTDYIHYVCIHELAHLKHMNHSKDFYALVSVYCPDYKKLVAQVRSAVL